MTQTLTPTQAWNKLVAGNARFVADKPEHPNQDATRRNELTGGQAPFTAVLSCGDSRATTELLFDVGLGDAFVVRNAGQVVDSSVLASLEYAVSALEVPLIVVLSHSHCGAVTAAFEAVQQRTTPDGFFVRDLLTRIQPAIVQAEHDHNLTLENVAAHHLGLTVDALLSHSSLLAAAVESGKLGIIGANYNLDDGTVTEAVHVGAF